MAKIGTDKKPVTARVQTPERANDILDICDQNGWKVIIGIEPDKPEDIADVRKLLGYDAENTKTVVNKEKIGRNEPCPCGSGKKYKKCCGV